MEIKKALSGVVKAAFDAQLTEFSQIGGGVAGGMVYRTVLDKSPFVVAIKTTKDKDLLEKECKYIKYIQQYADIKLPEIYFDTTIDNQYFVVMEYFDGVNCLSDYVLEASEENRKKVAGEIADNIIKLQSVKGEKYGDLLSPEFDDWHDYYKPFVKMVKREADVLQKEGYITKHILDYVNKAYENYDVIFDEPVSKPTIIHGDYWAGNLIVNKDFELIGVLDPFNSIWGDSEYELFALNAVHNGKIPILEAYMSKQSVSEKFMLKNYFYLLFSETFWVTKLHHDNIAYLNEIIDKLDTEIKKSDILKK